MRQLCLAATVGVAFGPNSDITSEAADAVILTTSLEKVDELIHISHRMRSIALQSAIGGMAASMVGMIAAAGWVSAPTGGRDPPGNYRFRGCRQCGSSRVSGRRLN